MGTRGDKRLSEEEKMEDVMESPVTCRSAEMLSVYVKAWHDIDSMIGHDDPIKK